MSLKELMNGRAFVADKDDLSFPQEIRFASTLAVFANVSRNQVRLALVEFDAKGVAHVVKQYKEVDSADPANEVKEFAIANKRASAIIFACGDLVSLSHVRSTAPASLNPNRVAQVLRRVGIVDGQSGGVEAVIGGRLSPAIDPKKFYIPVSHKTHNSHVVFAWRAELLGAIPSAYESLPLAAYISCPASILSVVSDSFPDLFRTSDLIIKDGDTVVTISGDAGGDWSSALFHYCENDNAADNAVRGFLSERKRKGSSNRHIAYFDFGGTPRLSDSVLDEVRKSVPEEGGLFLSPEDSIALVLSSSGLSPALDLRPVFRAPRPVLPKSLSLLPKLAVVVGGIAFVATLVLLVSFIRVKKNREQAGVDLVAAQGDKDAAVAEKSAFEAKIRTSETYALWLSSGVNPQRISKTAIETMLGCRVEQLVVKPAGDRVKIEMDILPDPNPEPGSRSVSACIGAFQDSLQKGEGLEFFSGSQPVAAGKIRYQATFVRKQSSK
jgi:hypothetical protein